MKHFLLFSLSTATIFLAGPMNLDRRPSGSALLADRLPVAVVRPPSAVDRPPLAKMWVENTPVFYKNETIELFFDAPNAPFLGVLDPEGHFFYLVYPKENASGGLKPVVESADFIKMTSLHVPTANFRADPYTFGATKNRPVFTRSGKYTFIMGENLHVDDPDELERVVVEYIHQNRPAQVVAMN